MFMRSIEDLQKVLKQKAKTISICKAKGCIQAGRKFYIDETVVSLGDVKELFSAFMKDNVFMSRKDLRDVLEVVQDKPLKDFINSLLKIHYL